MMIDILINDCQHFIDPRSSSAANRSWRIGGGIEHACGFHHGLRRQFGCRVWGDCRSPPGADEALIEVRAAGTNPVEISMREGHFKATLPFSFPQVMGYDIAGIVASAPAGSAFKAGDEVYARLPNRRLGAYAERAVVPVSLLPRKPRSLSFEEAAGLPTVALTTWQAFMERAQLKSGD